jgi:hypothetical protein
MLLQNDSNFMTATSARMNPHITQKTPLTLTNSIPSQQSHSIIKTTPSPQFLEGISNEPSRDFHTPKLSNIAYYR